MIRFIQIAIIVCVVIIKCVLALPCDATFYKQSDDIQFFLYTKRNSEPQQLIIETTRLQNTYFDIGVNTMILVHDRDSDINSLMGIVNTLLKYSNYNAILVDWTKYSNSITTNSAEKVSEVATKVAALIKYLLDNNAIKDKIEAIGVGMGAHIAGQAAIKISEFRRVTGLDPPKYGFETPALYAGLSKNCAKFVDVIHTSSNTNGYAGQCGSADFYPNNGFDPQPGCQTTCCSFKRAVDYYIESIINTSGFKSLHCDSWEKFIMKSCSTDNPTFMGYNADRSKTGKFYLTTNCQSPFAKNTDYRPTLCV